MNIRPFYAFLLSCLLIIVIGWPVLFAQTEPAQNQISDVVIDGRVVLQIRTGIKSVTSEMRAHAIKGKIVRLASDPYFNTNSITVVETDLSSDIMANDYILMSVLDVDAQAAGRSRQDLAAQYAQIFRTTIDQYRRDHSKRNMLKSSLLALLSTIGLIITLFIIQKLYRKIESEYCIRAYNKFIPERIKKHNLIDPNLFSSLICKGAKYVRLVVVIAILYCYFSLVFSHFPSTRGLADKLLDFVIQPLTICWQALQKQMPNLFFIFILVMITRYFLKLLHAFFRSIEKGKIKIKNFEQDLAIPTYKLIRVFVIIFAATVAYPFVPGSESPAFKGISIFLGVLVSLGSTSFVSNVIAGLTMTFMRAFKIGDIVKIDDIFGMIVATRLQVTQIKSIKNEIITVPNSKIINSNVMNYSALAQKRGLILHTTVGIGYNAPWRQVRAMLLLAAEKTPGLLRDPAPFVFQLELDNMRVVYEINAYTDQPQKMKEIYSNLHKNILDQFNEYGVEILTPNYETDRATPAIVPKEQWHAAPADRFSEKESEIKKDYSGDAAA